MSGVVAGLLMQLAVARGVVRDAVTGAPVAEARVQVRGLAGASGADGQFVVPAAPGDTIRVRRVGFHRTAVVFDGSEVRVALVPLAAPVAAVAVVAPASAASSSITRDVDSLRAAGITSTAGALAALPFVSARSARGMLALSLRGSRPEQVLVLLDGLPLNDPATGVADVSDLPLAALGSVTVAPGASGARYGPGASGGVIALASGERPAVALHARAHGDRGVEGAWRVRAAGAAIRFGGSVRRATNDFRFVNTAGARDTLERRVNADEQLAAVFASATWAGLRLWLLGAATDRGLSGPMNVRIYDAARERTHRAVVRAQVDLGSWTAVSGGRALRVTYVDPANPAAASAATAASVDLEAFRAAGALGIRAGAGFDAVRGSSLPPHGRARVFAAANYERRAPLVDVDAALRADAVQGAGLAASPTIEVATRGATAVTARLASAVRAPTFVDLYLASPQRFIARDVRPERVALDGTVGVRRTSGAWHAAVSVFERRTRDAIIWFPGTFTWSPQNVSHERVRGIEAIAGWRGAVAAEAWAAAYSTALEVDAISVPTPYVPRVTGGTTATLPVGAWTGSVALRVVGRRPFALAARTGAGELPAARSADVRIARAFTILGLSALATAGVDNVSDTHWQPVRGYPAPGRTWSATLNLRP